MAGHNKWSKIKHKKAVTDAQKSATFSRLAKLIKTEAQNVGGDMNAPGLRAAIDKAKSENMPKENIERAVQSAEKKRFVEKVLYEAYGPGGTALIIEGMTDNKNRTSSEIKHIFSKHDLELARPGSATWAFEEHSGVWTPKTTVSMSEEDRKRLKVLVDELESYDDVQNVITNAV